jgi:nucleotide-binding universal stress UspA family protein
MFEKILVPLDGSELAEAALPYVQGLAERLDSEAILFTVCEQGEWLERPLRAYLKKRAEELQSLGIKASPLIVEGDPAYEILDFAQKNNVGLIAISTHGRTGISRWALGSIANKVLQKSHIPLFLVRSKGIEEVLEERKLRKILVPLDGSPFAEGVVPFVEEIAGGMSEVILLKVIESFSIPQSSALYVSDWGKMVKDYIASAESETEQYLTKYESALREKDIKVSSIWLHGSPAQTILKYAMDKSVDLIAISTHGYSGVTRWAFGSVASKIIEDSSKPLLLIRPPRKKQ